MVIRIYRCKTILIFAMHLFVLTIYPGCGMKEFHASHRYQMEPNYERTDK